MPATAIRTRVWRNGVLEREDFPFEEVSDYAEQPDCLVWADLLQPDHHEVGQIAEELELDPHAVEDALAERERPKAMRYPTHVFVTAYSASYRDGDLHLGRISAFKTARCLVTVRLDDSVDLDGVLSRWDDEADLLTCGPRALAHGLLDEIVDRYFDVTESIEDEIDDLESELFKDEANVDGRKISQQCFTLRRMLVRLRRAVAPMRDVVGTMMRAAQQEGQSEINPYFEDLYDHTLRATEWVDGLRDTVTSIFETNMSLADTRMNTIMKKLTSWAAIIAVPTAVTGFYGQNVPYPGFGHTWGFWVSVVAMVLIAAALYSSFKRRDWL